MCGVAGKKLGAILKKQPFEQCYSQILREGIDLSPMCLISLVSERLMLHWCLHLMSTHTGVHTNLQIKWLNRNVLELSFPGLYQIIIHRIFLVPGNNTSLFSLFQAGIMSHCLTGTKWLSYWSIFGTLWQENCFIKGHCILE